MGNGGSPTPGHQALAVSWAISNIFVASITSLHATLPAWSCATRDFRLRSLLGRDTPREERNTSPYPPNGTMRPVLRAERQSLHTVKIKWSITGSSLIFHDCCPHKHAERAKGHRRNRTALAQRETTSQHFKVKRPRCLQNVLSLLHFVVLPCNTPREARTRIVTPRVRASRLRV